MIRSGWIPGILTLLVLLGAASSSRAQQPEPSAPETVAATVAATAVPETPDGSPEIAPTPEEGHVHDGFLFRAMLGGGYYYRYDEVVSYNWYPARRYTKSLHWVGGDAVFAFGGSPCANLHLYGEVVAGYPQVGTGFGIGGYLPGNWMIDASAGYAAVNAGYGALSIGKEWWVTPETGMGIVLRTTVYGGTDGTEVLFFDKNGESARNDSSLNTTVFLYWTITYN
jgi:hypothetical protein